MVPALMKLTLAMINKQQYQVLSVWLRKHREFRECTVGAPGPEGINEGFLDEAAHKPRPER